MTKYKNPRELEEMMDEEHQELDKQVEKDVAPEEDKVDWKSRYAELRRHEAKKQADKDAELERLKKRLEGIENGTVKPPKSREEIAQWKETYPEFADVLDTWIKEAIAESTADLRRKNAQSEKEKALLRLKEKHPDCEAIFIDQEFHDWLAEQSQLARDTIYKSFNVKEAAYVLDRYKADTGKTSKNDGVDEDDPKAAAKAVRVRTQPKVNEDVEQGFEYSESQIERESAKNPKWWDANEEKILNALRRGKVLLDLSGGARG